MAQPVPGHLHDVVDPCLACGRLQEHPRAAVQVEDVAPVVDQRAGGDDLLQQGPFRQLAQRQLHDQARLGPTRGQGLRDRRRARQKTAQGRALVSVRVWLLLIQLGLAILGREQRVKLTHPLRGAQEQVAVGVQGVVEQRNELPLQPGA